MQINRDDAGVTLVVVIVLMGKVMTVMVMLILGIATGHAGADGSDG